MRRAALGIVLLAIAVWTAAPSGASFTGALGEDPASFGGGTLDLTLDGPATTPLDGAFMRPGQLRNATIVLRNAGTVPATLHAGLRDLVDTPATAGLSRVLGLTIQDCGTSPACDAPTTAYDGSLADLADADLGPIDAGGTRRLRVTLQWGATKNDPSRQGSSATALLVWRAVAGESK